MTPHLRCTLKLFAATLAICCAGAQAAQQAKVDLRIHAFEDPCPALHEAAVAFMQSHNVRVEVTTGAPKVVAGEPWQKSDVVLACAESTVAEVAEHWGVTASAVSPLYMRPAVILVRPDNPHEVHGLADLFQSDLKVMVVTNADKADLWKEMLYKLRDVEQWRALRKNVVAVAATDTDAIRMWRENPEIDAYVTWNVWHTPLRSTAKVVPIGKDFQIDCQCSALVNPAAKNNPVAAQFVEFLRTGRTAEIFESWAWRQPKAGENPFEPLECISIACRIQSPKTGDAQCPCLAKLDRLLKDCDDIGIPRHEVCIKAILEGDTGFLALRNETFTACTNSKTDNPHANLIASLLETGVTIELSDALLEEHGWKKEDILPGVKIVSADDARGADLAEQGFVEIRL